LQLKDFVRNIEFVDLLFNFVILRGQPELKTAVRAYIVFRHFWQVKIAGAFVDSVIVKPEMITVEIAGLCPMAIYRIGEITADFRRNITAPKTCAAQRFASHFHHHFLLAFINIS
jgi:hypothetical protein